MHSTLMKSFVNHITLPVDLNIQNINDIDSDEEYNEINVDETYTGNTDTILQTCETDVSSITHIIAPGEGNIPVFNKPLAKYSSFPTIFCGKANPQVKKDLLKSIQVKSLHGNYIQLTLEFLFISQIFLGNQNTYRWYIWWRRCPWSCEEITW